MADINHYAADLLLDFADAFHACLKTTLQSAFGLAWLEKGVQCHFKADYFDRTRKMLMSPMRTIDMGKSDEDLFGVEHLWTIVNGNKQSFATKLGNMTRAQAYLDEITELRHNLSHRRRKHVLKRSELLRFVQNARMLLSALESPAAATFESAAEQMVTGGSPWGRELAGTLPPAHAVVDEFVGRPRELGDLSSWLVSDAPQAVIWGYGGAGKSATAFQFARQVQEGGIEPLDAVCWASAKSVELREGREQPLRADFHDIESLAHALLTTLYGDMVGESDAAPDRLLQELNDNRCLVVIDDFDTVLQDVDMAKFLLYDLRSTRSRVLFTSRNRVPGLPTIEIRGFPIEELRDFVKSRSKFLDVDAVPHVEAIARVTGSFPLFVIDLLRYARMFGIQTAIEDWQQRKGDAARSYALRRQLGQLGGAAPDALIAISVANRPLTLLEIASISGTTDEDAQHALTELESWRLIERVHDKLQDAPGFDMNANTRRLVQKTYSGDEKVTRHTAAFRHITGSPMSMAMRTAIASAISVAKFLTLRNDIEGAIRHINGAMIGELRQSPELHGFLGWVCSHDSDKRLIDARAAFKKAYELGARKWDIYLHWSKLEERCAEHALASGDEVAALACWREGAQVATWGVDRCGETRILCQLASYSRTREGRLLTRMKKFAAAQSVFAEAVGWARRALAAPSTGEGRVGLEHRSLVLALEGTENLEAVAKSLIEWGKISGDDDLWRAERDRLCSRYARLEEMLADDRSATS